MTVEKDIHSNGGSQLPELEKVVKGLEICCPDLCTKDRRSRCPYYEGPDTDYWSNPDGYMCDYNLRRDAIDLLNAQAKENSILKNSLDSVLDGIMQAEAKQDPQGENVVSLLERPLTIDEVKQVGGFYIEMRSAGLKVYRTDSIRIVRCVDGEAVHLICKHKPFFEIAEFDNYNIGWRAWLKLPTDEISSRYPWDDVRKCKGIGYGWEYNVNQFLSERCNDTDNARVVEIWQ